MNVDLNMKLDEYLDEDVDDKIDSCSGFFSFIESSERIIRLVKSTHSPKEFLKSEDVPGAIGVLDYTFYRISKIRRRKNEYYGYDELGGGIYIYTEDTTLNDFLIWLRNTEGYTLHDKILDYKTRFTQGNITDDF